MSDGCERGSKSCFSAEVVRRDGLDSNQQFVTSKGRPVLGADFPLLDIFLSTLFLVLLVFWLVLAFHVLQDLFRSADLGGPLKAFWVLFILVPLIGCLVYLVVRGGSMHERQMYANQDHQQAFEDYIRRVSNTKE
jgi:hypothetical protein